MPQQQAAGIGRTVKQLLRYAFLGPIPIANRWRETKGDQYLMIALASVLAAGSMMLSVITAMYRWGPEDARGVLPGEMDIFILLFPLAVGSFVVAFNEAWELGGRDSSYKQPGFVGSVVGVYVLNWLIIGNHARITGHILSLDLQTQVISMALLMFTEFYLIILGMIGLVAVVAAVVQLLRDRYGDRFGPA